MKRRTFLKYLCSVVPVALVDPAILIPKDENPLVGRWVFDGYVDGKPVRWHSEDLYESESQIKDDVILGMIKRDGRPGTYIHLKVK